MTFTLQVRRAAELEIAEAQLWYEAKEKGLGPEFLAEVSQTINRILESPFIYQSVHRDVRRAMIHRFPYLIWYQVVTETIVVLACTYAGRDPQHVRTHLR